MAPQTPGRQQPSVPLPCRTPIERDYLDRLSGGNHTADLEGSAIVGPDFSGHGGQTRGQRVGQGYCKARCTEPRTIVAVAVSRGGADDTPEQFFGIRTNRERAHDADG